MNKVSLPSPKIATYIRRALADGYIYWPGKATNRDVDTFIGERWLWLCEGGRFYPTTIGQAALAAYDAREANDPLIYEAALNALKALLDAAPLKTRPTLEGILRGDSFE